jgi:hypothetical protein
MKGQELDTRDFNRDNLIKEDDGVSSHASSNSITSLRESKNNLLRISGIISSLTIILLIFLTLFFYFFYGSTHDYHILLFEYKSGNYTPLETHAALIVIYLFILIFFYAVISYSLIFQNEKEFMKIFSLIKFTRLFLIMNGVLIAFFFSCCFFGKTVATSIINLVLLISSTACNVVTYKRIKIKKKLSPFALVGISFFLSVLLAFSSYLILYGFCDLLTINSGEAYQSDDYKQICAIVFNLIYCGIAVVLLSIHKDIIFSLALILIEVGYISNTEALALDEQITGMSIIAFIVVSVLFTLLKYKKAVFGYEDTEVLIKDLENDWKENMRNEYKNNKNHN